MTTKPTLKGRIIPWRSLRLLQGCVAVLPGRRQPLLIQLDEPDSEAALDWLHAQEPGTEVELCPCPAFEENDVELEIYNAQRALNQRILGFDPCAISVRHVKLKWFRNFLTAWDQELKELAETVDPVLLAAEGVTAFDANNAKVEVVDMLHFLLSMLQVLGETKLDFQCFPPTKHGSVASFEALFDQYEQETLYGARCVTQRAKTIALQPMCLRALITTGRLLDKVHWKWWAKQATDWEGLRTMLYEEVFPIWVQLALITGLTATSVAELYMKKNKLNHQRQDGGYKEGHYRKEDAAGTEDNAKLFEQE